MRQMIDSIEKKRKEIPCVYNIIFLKKKKRKEKEKRKGTTTPDVINGISHPYAKKKEKNKLIFKKLMSLEQSYYH